MEVYRLGLSGSVVEVQDELNLVPLILCDHKQARQASASRSQGWRMSVRKSQQRRRGGIL